MNEDDSEPDGERSIRAVYTENDHGSVRVATIADPTNDRAWIQSNVVLAVVP